MIENKLKKFKFHSNLVDIKVSEVKNNDQIFKI
jgi:hypothetical protein